MSTTDFSPSTSHKHNHANSFSKNNGHHLSLPAAISPSKILHAPTTLLSSIQRHEHEIIINHEARRAKKDAARAIEAEEATYSYTPSVAAHSQGAANAAKVAMTPKPSDDDDSEWAAIAAARRAATKKSPTQRDMEAQLEEAERERAAQRSSSLSGEVDPSM